jgi:hypothetical protein
MPRRSTQGEAAIDALLDKLDPQSHRYQVLVAARDFKASWVELAERLTSVRESGGFRTWGYAGFEAYCRTELHIKAETANKLTRSFAFLRDRSPQVLAGDNEREVPALDVIDLLSRAREKTKLSDEQVTQIEQEVFESPTEANRSAVMKRFREVDPEAFKPAARDAAPSGAANNDVDMRKALLLAERLAGLLGETEVVSKSARDGLNKVVNELRQVSKQKEAVAG